MSKSADVVLLDRYEMRFAGAGHWVLLDKLVNDRLFFIDYVPDRQRDVPGTWTLTRKDGTVVFSKATSPHAAAERLAESDGISYGKSTEE